MGKNSKKMEDEAAKKEAKTQEDAPSKKNTADTTGAQKAEASAKKEEDKRKGERRTNERRNDERRKEEVHVEDPRLVELREKVTEKEEELLKLRGEADSLKDLLQRRQADFDNYKKRNAKMMEDSRKFAIKDFAFDIILINDDLLRAIEASSSVSKEEGTSDETHQSFVEGVSMVSKRIEETFQDYGIEQIEAEGQPFDPNFHEAVEIEMSEDVDVDTVTYVHQKGFRIDEMVVRSAKVKVAKPMPKQSAPVAEETPPEGE